MTNSSTGNSDSSSNIILNCFYIGPDSSIYSDNNLNCFYIGPDSSIHSDNNLIENEAVSVSEIKDESHESNQSVSFESRAHQKSVILSIFVTVLLCR